MLTAELVGPAGMVVGIDYAKTAIMPSDGANEESRNPRFCYVAYCI